MFPIHPHTFLSKREELKRALNIPTRVCQAQEYQPYSEQLLQ